MNAAKVRNVVRGVLLSFVLVSIGFAIGRQTAPGPASGAGPAVAAEPPAPADGNQVVVYYLRATIRCATCNKVEAMADELIRTTFAEPLRQGRLVWKKADFMKDQALADRYNVSGSMIVVVRFEHGRQVDCRRLADVLALANRREQFLHYVGEAIRASLAGQKEPA